MQLYDENHTAIGVVVDILTQFYSKSPSYSSESDRRMATIILLSKDGFSTAYSMSNLKSATSTSYNSSSGTITHTYKFYSSLPTGDLRRTYLPDNYLGYSEDGCNGTAYVISKSTGYIEKVAGYLPTYFRNDSWIQLYSGNSMTYEKSANEDFIITDDCNNPKSVSIWSVASLGSTNCRDYCQSNGSNFCSSNHIPVGSTVCEINTIQKKFPDSISGGWYLAP